VHCAITNQPNGNDELITLRKG